LSQLLRLTHLEERKAGGLAWQAAGREGMVCPWEWRIRGLIPSEAPMRLLTNLCSFASALALLGGCATIDSTIAVGHEKAIASTHLTAAREVSVETVRTA